jgi:hypothetical protein
MMQHAAKRGQTAIAMVCKKFHQLGIASNIDLKLRLLNAVALPNLSFGCEVWTPWLLSSDWSNKAFQSKIEQVRLSFVRVLLSLKSSTPAWNVYREPWDVPPASLCGSAISKVYQQAVAYAREHLGSESYVGRLVDVQEPQV